MKKEYAISISAVIAATAVVITLFSITNRKTDNIVDLDTKTKDNTSDTEPAKIVSASINAAKQTLNLHTSTLKDAKTPQLQVAEILVSPGQQVQNGTPLIQLTADSVKSVRTALQKEILETGKVYELLTAKQKELHLQTVQTYDNYITDGKYSNTIYNDKCDELQKKTALAKAAVDKKQNEVNENLLELTQLQQDLADAQRSLREAEIAVSENYKTRYQNAYYYAVYENTRETALDMVTQLEEQIRLHTEKNEALLYEVNEAVHAYHQSVLEQEKENLSAKLNRDTQNYYCDVAPKWRDIQTVELDNALLEARMHYENALQNIRDFNTYIAQNRILSEHSGIISDIMVEPGDCVMQDDTLVIFAPPAQSSP